MFSTPVLHQHSTESAPIHRPRKLKPFHLVRTAFIIDHSHSYPLAHVEAGEITPSSPIPQDGKLKISYSI